MNYFRCSGCHSKGCCGDMPPQSWFPSERMTLPLRLVPLLSLRLPPPNDTRSRALTMQHILTGTIHCHTLGPFTGQSRCIPVPSTNQGQCCLNLGVVTGAELSDWSTTWVEKFGICCNETYSFVFNVLQYLLHHKKNSDTTSFFIQD